MLKKILDNIKTSGIKNTCLLIKSTIIKRLDSRTSYSQYNEDLLIDALLGHKDHGFYIDVGAYNPETLNNTKIFFDRGWKGINIDPNPDTIKKFEEVRPSDINLNIGLSNEAGKLRAVLFENCRSFTLSGDLIKQKEEENQKIISDMPVEVKPLTHIFETYVKGRKVDFISVDTEGLDLDVLMSNDWEKYRPTVVCVETYNEEGDNKTYKKQIHNFMFEKGYKLAHDTGLNSIFIEK